MKAARTLAVLGVTLVFAGIVRAADRKPSARRPAAKGGAAAEMPREFRSGGIDGKITTATWGPKRTTPVFTGAFQVDLVTITFPDCTQPEPKTVHHDLDHIQGGAYTIKEYYDDYSQGMTYPVLAAYPAIYVAPKPFGHYCRWDRWNNKIGWKSDGEGGARARQLRQDALAFAQKNARGFRKGAITCYVYCHELDRTKVVQLLREAYPKPANDWEKDEIESYNPQIAWAEPLWPNSLPQTTWPSDGRAMVHELGHVLGSPDYYHAPEKHDGIEGEPSLPWGYGPTGLAYDRAIYHAFVPPGTYPTCRTNGVYTLDPRSSRVVREGTRGDASRAAQPVLGCFIPSSHPNYMFYLEYVYGETKPVGHPGEQGLLIHVINVTFTSPMMGPPDLCYTYRRGDPFFKATGNGADAYFRTGDTFTMKSDPIARIPPLIPGGIEITDIREQDGRCSFQLTFTNPPLTPKDLKDALLPRIRLVGVDEILPTSMRPSCEVMYRGEPLMDEYGFTWDTKKNPVIQKNRYPLYHRDRWDARILDLQPGTTYYVRAYVRNANGVTYSKREIEVKTPASAEEIPPLLTDRILNNFYLTRWYFTIDPDGQWCNSASTILSLMSTGVYYGSQPGGVAKGGKGIEMRKVHTHPNEGRPGFRMEPFEAYFSAMKSLADAAGLRARTFGKLPEWTRRCAKALKIKDVKKAFVEVRTADDLKKSADAIRKWLDLSQPVWLIRENDFMPEVTDRRYPLDVALIDGVNAAGKWHVTFPLGTDRNTVPSGYYDAETLMIKVTNAVLFFYRP
ncbi:MAG: hypothetical protein ACI4R9_09040 [Kiritimatiellia bacterium]